MTATESEQVKKELKDIHLTLTEYSEKGQLDLFLSYFDNSPAFIQIGSDGNRRNYEELKQACMEYYAGLKQQKISTITEKFNVLTKEIVILAWTGNILAEFKNGDRMKMNNYSITNVFKKEGGKWKIIHSHESALPPEIIKK